MSQLKPNPPFHYFVIPHGPRVGWYTGKNGPPLHHQLTQIQPIFQAIWAPLNPVKLTAKTNLPRPPKVPTSYYQHLGA